MRNLTRILIGTDFSPAAGTALRSAVGLARRYRARIHLVTVVSPPPVYRRALAPLPGGPMTIEKLVEAAGARLDAVAQSPDLADLHVETEVRVGTPFSELILAARERGDSLIAVGTRPHARLEETFLGGTAERVMRKAPVPVLVTRTELAATPGYILTPIDFSAASRSAAEEALALARRWEARLVFLHVIEPIAQTYLWPLDPGAVEVFPAEPADLERDWDEFLRPLPLQGTRHEHRSLKGDPGRVVQQVADTEAADLIVIGTHGRTGLVHALLGSIAERIVRTTSKPVLTVRPQALPFTLP